MHFMSQREPREGDIWMWESYNSRDYYLLLSIELKEQKQPSGDGTYITVHHWYYDILSLNDGKIYTSYSCSYGIGHNSNWRFVC